MARILGIDFGERRVGIAVSDPDGIVATPVETAEVTSMRETLARVQALCAETGAERIVVGYPLNMNGTAGPMAARVDAFVTALRGLVAVPVDTWDERLSSGMVERVLLAADLSRRRRKEVRDKLAAQVILQGYLDAHGAPA